MEYKKILKALANANEELQKGGTTNFELDLLQIAFDQFAEGFELLTGEKLTRKNLLEYFAIFREPIIPGMDD